MTVRYIPSEIGKIVLVVVLGSIFGVAVVSSLLGFGWLPKFPLTFNSAIEHQQQPASPEAEYRTTCVEGVQYVYFPNVAGQPNVQIGRNGAPILCNQ